ncbi:MAG: hypothetical protein PVI26_05600 [Chitinispirillia bacterium]|jgi:hypothetical protein
MNNYNIKKADLEKNRTSIFSLFEKNKVTNTNSKFQWNYNNCPFGKALCYFVQDENTKEYIGSTSLFKRKFKVVEKNASGAVAGNLCVNQDQRLLLPALKLVKASQIYSAKEDIQFIYSFPNQNSFGISEGYTKIGEFSKFLKILKITDSIKRYLPFYPLFSPLFFVFNILIKLFSKETFLKKEKGLSVEFPEMFDNRFDSLWAKASEQFTIIGIRNSEFLNWRYVESPHTNYKIFCLVNKSQEILGYIVYSIEKDICSVADMLFLKTDNILDSLLLEFSRTMRKKGLGYIYISFFGDSKIKKKLEKYNFIFIKKYKRILKNIVESPFLLYCNDKTLGPVLFDEEYWHIFLGDSDI